MTGRAGPSIDDSAEPPSPPADRHPPSRHDRDRLLAAAIAALGGIVVIATLHHSGAVVGRRALGINWQIDSLRNLAADPLSSTWYRHVQPPLYNLFIGGIFRWSPFPPIGTLQVLWALSLLACFLLLADILVRLRVPPIAAGLVTVLALANPNLLVTIPIGSYEVPLAMLFLAALSLVLRILDDPTAGRWILLSAVLTAMALTRSLFHPVWVLGVLAVVALLRRPPDRRVLIAALLLPTVLIGGWMVKNQILFGERTLSSWIGFNMTRGITATMTEDQVRAGIVDGSVSRLALEYPWGRLGQYEDWTDGCVPGNRHPSLHDLLEPDHGAANFNNECFLPIYRRASADAMALIRANPGRYLTTRWEPIRWSFAMSALGYENTDTGFAGGTGRAPTWMDRAGDRWLLPIDAVSDQSDWNLPLLGVPELPGRISMTLVAGFVIVLVRGGIAGWRLTGTLRLRRRASAEPPEPGDDERTLEIDDADPRADLDEETVWFLVAVTAVMLVLGSALLEFGENGRFRALLDPLLVALPLGVAARRVTSRFDRAREP